MAADLVLPAPSSVLLVLGGWALGWHIGALVGAAGMLAGNLAGYWLCRLAGRRPFEKLVGPGEAERFGKWLGRWGPMAVIASRLVPAVAETLSCLAGLGRMKAPLFAAALILGTVPVALSFSVLGAAGRQAGSPELMLYVSLAVPAAGWLAFGIFVKRSERGNRA